jgi:hypothetical protein
LIYPTINIINLSHRIDKRNHIIAEFKKHNIRNYQFWQAIDSFKPTFISIEKSHKMIVIDAKRKGLDYCIIAEDDCCLSDIGAFQYYLDNMPKEFSLYMSSIYWGEINEYNIVKDFCGFTLYTIHSSYYDTFLNINEIGHIDRSQADRIEVLNSTPIVNPKGKFIVSPLFCTYQLEIPSDNRDGITDENVVRIVNNEQYLHHRKFYSNTKDYFTWKEVYARSLEAANEDSNALIAASL